MNQYLLFALIIFLIFYFIIHPIINYMNWIKWWYSNNKIGKPVGSTVGFDCFDYISFAFANQNYITYKIWNLFNSSENQVTDIQIQFITMLLQVYSTAVGGFLLPYHLCGSLVPLQTVQGQNWPTTQSDWVYMLNGWATRNHYDISTNNAQSYLKLIDLEHWTTEPTNFLYRQWGISPASQIVTAFITGLTSDNSNQLYIRMMTTLLIPNSVTGRGGWIEFIKEAGSLFGEGDNPSIDIIYQTIWEDMERNVDTTPDAVKNHKNSTGGCGTGQIVSSIAQGAMAGLMTAAMIPPPLGIIAGLIIGAGTMAGPIITCAT